jgi:hypothetical protein
MAMMDWSLDLSKLNTVQIAELNGFLNKSETAKALLILIGVPPQTDSLLRQIYGHMKIEISPVVATSERARVEQDFTHHVMAVTGPAGP